MERFLTLRRFPACLVVFSVVLEHPAPATLKLCELAHKLRYIRGIVAAVVQPLRPFFPATIKY
jgi:hypothetical protein